MSAPAQGQQSSRFEEFLASVPVVTRALLIINVAAHIVIFVFSWSLNTFAISANLVINSHEYYRIVSAAFTHAGLMHIFMNMSSLLQLGLSLEAHFGSLQFLFLSLWAILVVGMLYIALAVLFSYIDAGQFYASGVGYSGVLFTYALVEAYHTTEVSRSIFGLFSVPAKMYPFILLIILQVVIPNISFMGHLSGILVGLLVVYGGMNVLLPSTGALHNATHICSMNPQTLKNLTKILPLSTFCTDFLIYLETTTVFAPLTRATGYIRASNRSLVHGGSSQPLSCYGSCSSACSMMYACMIHVWNVIAALLYIIGCPVERLTKCFSDACSALQTSFSSVNVGNPLEGNGGGGTVELGRYARIETSAVDIESDPGQARRSESPRGKSTVSI